MPNDSKKWRSPDNPHVGDDQQSDDGHRHRLPLPFLAHRTSGLSTIHAEE
jgi:hypothetical protein